MLRYVFPTFTATFTHPGNINDKHSKKYGKSWQHIIDKESEMGSCPSPHAELVTEYIQSHHPVFSALYLKVM